MSRYTFTLLGLLLMTAFGIFFGIEIATRGMERIQGPVNGPYYGPSAPVSVQQAPSAASTGQSGGYVRPSAATPTPQPQPQQGKGNVAGAANVQGQAGQNTLPPIGAGVPVGHGDSNVNRLGNGIGNLLQGVANQTIRAVVGIFDGLVN